jgi:hypothetical protein
MTSKKDSQALINVTFRLPLETVRRLDSEAERLMKASPNGGIIFRSAFLRQAVREFLYKGDFSCARFETS